VVDVDGVDISLIPCPFCGSEDLSIEDARAPDDGKMVYCHGCIAQGPLCESRFNAAMTWNKRHTLKSLPVASFPYPTDRDGWICSVCHGWNVPKDRVCIHSHLPAAPEERPSALTTAFSENAAIVEAALQKIGGPHE